MTQYLVVREAKQQYRGVFVVALAMVEANSRADALRKAPPDVTEGGREWKKACAHELHPGKTYYF